MTTEAHQHAGQEGAARLAAEIAEAERQERERLAEALHDDALQRLLVARQELAEASGDPEALRAVQRQLDELTESLRSLTTAMHEDTLVTLPLSSALERLAEDGARRGRLVVHTRVAPDATGDHDAFVLGVARELLTNVVKHAGATTVDVAVGLEDDAVTIRVADDGRGMSAEDVDRARRAGHMGHERLRRRLTAIGGTLRLDSAPDAGTTVTCTLPLQNLQAQRTLEETLRRERRWSAALVAAMQDGFLVLRDGVTVEVNDRLCSMTGFRREELVGAPGGGLPLWPADERERFEALARDARAPGGAASQAALLRRDGSRFAALLAARSIHDGAGGDAGLLVTVKDITTLEQAAERRRLELELTTVVATTNRLRGLLDAAHGVRDEPGLDALLREVARTIADDLGWAVVLNLYRPAWDDFVVATGDGAGDVTTWAEWTAPLDDRFERRGAYLVTTGPGDAPDAWEDGDALLIPLRHSLGHFLGILALDAPASGRRPTDAELDVLVGIAAHAALAVQHAQMAIDGARRTAALDRLLQVSSRIAATREVGPMLDVVADAIAGALGFERVLVEVAGEDGRLRPHALRDPALGPAGEVLAPVAPGELAMLLDPGFGVEGCFLLGRDEAAGRMPAARSGLLGSRRNGLGWRAWDDHLLLVPLHAEDDRVVGVIWAGDPVDRLLPGDARLKALRAFADQAGAALIAAERYARLETVAEGDPLTRLGNRRAFLRELEREVARSARAGSTAVVVLADVAGCPALLEGADAATVAGARPSLGELAEIFGAELRRHDRAFRLEGTLFALLLTGGARPSEPAAVTGRVAERLRLAGAGRDVHVDVGTATVGPQPVPAVAVIRRASADLLAARRGRAG